MNLEISKSFVRKWIGAENFCSKNILTAWCILIVTNNLFKFILEHHTQPLKSEFTFVLWQFARLMLNTCFSFLHYMYFCLAGRHHLDDWISFLLVFKFFYMAIALCKLEGCKNTINYFYPYNILLFLYSIMITVIN